MFVLGIFLLQLLLRQLRIDHSIRILPQRLRALLALKGIPIGVVTAIAASASLKVDFEGGGGHAGAALMPSSSGDVVLEAAETEEKNTYEKVNGDNRDPEKADSLKKEEMEKKKKEEDRKKEEMEKKKKEEGLW